MLTLKKMHDDLDYWIFLQIGTDIVDMPGNRPEYQHLVSEAKRFKIPRDQIPFYVLWQLKRELSGHVLFSKTYYRLLLLNLMKRFQ